MPKRSKFKPGDKCWVLNEDKTIDRGCIYEHNFTGPRWDYSPPSTHYAVNIGQILFPILKENVFHTKMEAQQVVLEKMKSRLDQSLNMYNHFIRLFKRSEDQILVVKSLKDIHFLRGHGLVGFGYHS